MAKRNIRIHALVFWELPVAVVPAFSQVKGETTLGGPDTREVGYSPHGKLFGDWAGARSRLEEKGVAFDLQYVSDFLWIVDGQRKIRLAVFDRIRGTVDIDFSPHWHRNGLYFHATALWRTGAILGNYLGLLTSPSGLSSGNAFRLDSWWFEKRVRDERIAMRIGQFAGQDFYGVAHYGPSFIFEPMGYALGNLETTFETFDPPSTPAMELRVVPIRHVYVKSMMAGDRCLRLCS